VDQLEQRSLQGKKLLNAQRYKIISIVADGDSVGVEAHWTGELAVPLGTLSAGAEMKAAFAMFFHFRDGRITSQRNYDCFYPWQ
jgi:ketosteroid isomerase-like protein